MTTGALLTASAMVAMTPGWVTRQSRWWTPPSSDARAAGGPGSPHSCDLPSAREGPPPGGRRALRGRRGRRQHVVQHNALAVVADASEGVEPGHVPGLVDLAEQDGQRARTAEDLRVDVGIVAVGVEA